MSAPVTGRRGALLGLPLALGGTAAAAPLAAAEASAVLRQAQLVRQRYDRESVVAEVYFAAQGTDGERGASADYDRAMWASGSAVLTLASLPAATPHDILAKVAAVIWMLRDGPGEEEIAAASSIMEDIWKLQPELRHALHWAPRREKTGGAP